MIDTSLLIGLIGAILGAVGAYKQLKIWVLQLIHASSARIENVRRKRELFYEKLDADLSLQLAYVFKRLGVLLSVGFFAIMVTRGAESIESRGFWKIFLSGLSFYFSGLLGWQVGGTYRESRELYNYLKEKKEAPG